MVRFLTFYYKRTRLFHVSISVSNLAAIVSTIACLHEFNFESLIAGSSVNLHVAFVFVLMVDWVSIVKPPYVSKGAGYHLADYFCLCCVHFHCHFWANDRHTR